MYVMGNFHPVLSTCIFIITLKMINEWWSCLLLHLIKLYQTYFSWLFSKETEHIKNNLLKSYFQGKTSTQAHICTLSWKICLTVFGAVPEPLAEETQKWREVSSRFFVTAVESRGRGNDQPACPLGRARLHGHVHEKRGSRNCTQEQDSSTPAAQRTLALQN